MKMLVTSDHHGDKRTLGVSRLDDVRDAVNQTVEAAIRERVSLYAFLGDMTDPDAGPIVFRIAEIYVQAALHLRAAGIDSVWVAGNHDVLEDGTGCTTLAFLRPFAGLLPGCGRLIVAERPTTFELRDWNFLCLPFSAPSHHYDAVKYVEENLPVRDEPTIVLGHLHLPNMHPGEETTEMGRGRELMMPTALFADRRFTRVYNGHYHAGGTYGGVHVPGALVRFTFGEAANKPSYLIVELEAF